MFHLLLGRSFFYHTYLFLLFPFLVILSSVGWLYFCHINLCWLFKTKFCFIYIYTFILNFLREYFVDKIFDERDFIYLHMIKWFSTSYFWYNLVSLKKERTSFILTLSNRPLKQFSLKNCFLIRAKVLHSTRSCLTV